MGPPWKRGGVTLGCAAPQSGGMLIISTALGSGDPIGTPKHSADQIVYLSASLEPYHLSISHHGANAVEGG